MKKGRRKFQKGDRLPGDFFYCPPLTAEQHEKLIRVSSQACEELIAIMDESNDSTNWRPLSSSSSSSAAEDSGKSAANSSAVQMYECVSSHNKPDSNGNGRGFYKGKSFIKGSIREVFSLFDVSNTDQLRMSMSTLHKDVIDTMLLYKLVGSSPDHPHAFVGIKWTAMQSPVSFVSNRDFCYVEGCQDFVDKHGNRGWAISKQSIRLACCPSLEDSHGLVRGSIYRTGFVFIETRTPGVLEAMCGIQFDFKGNLPKWIKVKASARRINCLNDFNEYLHRMRLSNMAYKGDLDLVPKKDRNTCHLCSEKFRLLRRKCRCRKCGEVVCMKCNKKWIVDLPNIGLRKIRICTLCSVKARDDTSDHNFSVANENDDKISSFPSQYSSRRFNSIAIRKMNHSQSGSSKGSTVDSDNDALAISTSPHNNRSSTSHPNSSRCKPILNMKYDEPFQRKSMCEIEPEPSNSSVDSCQKPDNKFLNEVVPVQYSIMDNEGICDLSNLQKYDDGCEPNELDSSSILDNPDTLANEIMKIEPDDSSIWQSYFNSETNQMSRWVDNYENCEYIYDDKAWKGFESYISSASDSDCESQFSEEGKNYQPLPSHNVAAAFFQSSTFNEEMEKRKPQPTMNAYQFTRHVSSSGEVDLEIVHLG